MDRPGKRYLDEWILNKIEKEGFFADGREKPKTLDREVLEAYQLRKIQETVSWAVEKSPFYRGLLCIEDGVYKPEMTPKIETLKDVEKLAFTTQDDLRHNWQMMLCVDSQEAGSLIKLKSLGTTGEKKQAYFSGSDIELAVDFFHNAFRSIFDKTDKVLILLPCKSPGAVGRIMEAGLERMDIEPVPYGMPEKNAEYANLARAIKEQHITSIVAMPSQIAMLQAYARQMDLNSAISEGLRSVILGAEYVSGKLCQELEEEWDCVVYEHYGMTEMGSGGAISCFAAPNGMGYHPREADLYFEIVDPDTGLVVPDGEYGEIVFTTLTRTAMPLIRYRTGDISRWNPLPCRCGSVLKRLDKVRGRVGK